MTRQRAVEHDETVAQAAPLVACAVPFIGHTQIRNRGTVGGSLAHADPASELPAVALALDAQLEVASATGTRTVAATDFFEGTWTTAVQDDELLVAVHFPVWSDRAGFAVDEVARRLGDFALVGVACGVELDGSGTVSRAAIALLGMGAMMAGTLQAPLAARILGRSTLAQTRAELATWQAAPPWPIRLRRLRKSSAASTWWCSRPRRCSAQRPTTGARATC